VEEPVVAHVDVAPERPEPAYVEPLVAIDVQIEVEPEPVSPPPLEVEPTPHAATPAFQDETATIIDAPVEEIVPQAARAKKRSREEPSADISCSKSDVDDLLQRFGVSSLATPDSMQKTRASLKRLAGLDPTPPPPTASELRRLTARPPAVELTLRRPTRQRLESDAELPASHAGARPFAVALVAAGLVLAGLLGHYLPSWLAELRAEIPAAE